MNILDAIFEQRHEADRQAAMKQIRSALLTCIRVEKVGIDRAIELVRAKTIEAVDDPKAIETMYADFRVEEPEMSTEELDAAFAVARKETVDMMEEALSSAKEAFEGLRELVHIDEGR